MTAVGRRPATLDAGRFEEVEAFPPLADIDHGRLFALSLSAPTTAYTHGLHRFPAKFVPQVPAWALDSLAPTGAVVLDPFAGSGTTLVEAAVRGGTAIGVDVDPLARFIARAKVAPVDHGRIAGLGAELAARWRAPAEHLEAPMPDIAAFGHWFAPTQWGWVQSLRDEILALDCDDDERAFLLVVFSSILRWVSNADDQSQKTYVSGTLPKRPPAVPAVFDRFLRRAVDGLAELNRARHPAARTEIPAGADATALGLAPASVDLAVTSPPYLDSVDYPYNLMLEYFWLGPLIGVPDRRRFNALRRRPVGAKHPAAPLRLPGALDGFLPAEAMPPARRVAATTYFGLMERHFAELGRVLRPGARAVFVVGNSATLADLVPVHDCLARLAAGAGLSLERAFGYRIRRHYMKFPRRGRGGIILIDWVLVFRRTGAATAPAPLPRYWMTLRPGAVAH
ncbi:MAG TPA: DNA methyltransferase [Acidimicrobiia bacterium]|nr:DNA methyltransferase [Acidimicrobiia bacterium]